jgi:long-subunit fatty acid transport protein
MKRDLKSMPASKLFLAIVFFASLFPVTVFAGSVPYYYKNILVGDRAATMGGAYTAIADDASGTYYNPSGIVYTTGDSVSGSANVYHIQQATYKEAIGNNNWTRSSTTLIPNFFGLVKKFKHFTLGFSFVVPDSFVEHQDQQFTNLSALKINNYTLNLHSEDTTYLLGPSFAYKISDKLSVGITLYYSYRKYLLLENQIVAFSDGSYNWSFATASQKEGSMLPKLGITWSPIKPVSVGLTISRTFVFSSLVENQTNEKQQGSATVSNNLITSSYKQKWPTQIAFGVAYFPSPFWLVSFDMDYFTGSDFRKSVINYSLGSEYYINESNAVRMGFFTNLSNQYNIDPAKAGQPEKVDMYGVSGGYTLFGKSSSLTLGLIYSKGSGFAQIYGDYTRVALTRYNLTALVAASYGF